MNPQALPPSVRAIMRLAALGWVALTAAAAFGLRPVHRRDVSTRARWLQLTCRRALRALGIAHIRSGRTPRGKIIAANHLGYLDILILAAETPAVFVAKREVRDWPVFGALARMAGTIFIDRQKPGDVARVATELAPVLAAGVSVVLFLEGTSTDGREVLPFKSSLLAPAAQNEWPVIPAVLAYDVPAGRSAACEVCWWGDMTLAPHLWNLATLPWIRARVAWSAPIRSTDRKQLAAAAHAACVALRNGEDIAPISPAAELVSL